MRRSLLAFSICGLALTAAAPAQAAFPSVPGPIAYPYFTISEFDDRGGILTHGPRKRDQPTQLTEDPDDSSPSYSPDGRLIVLSGNRDPGSTLQGRTSHIFSVAVDGSNLQQLTDGPASDYDPTFTPNGKRIVFVSSRISSGRRDRSRYSSGVDVMRADGRGFSKEFASGGTEEEGFGDRVGAPGWGPRVR